MHVKIYLACLIHLYLKNALSVYFKIDLFDFWGFMDIIKYCIEAHLSIMISMEAHLSIMISIGAHLSIMISIDAHLSIMISIKPRLTYQKSGASFYDEIDYLKAFTCTLDIVK